MRKIKKIFQKPRSPWDKERMEKENELMKTYGLRRKSEVWKAESIMRNFKRRARNLAAIKDKTQEKILLDKLNKMGLLSKDVSLDSVLSLTTENLLERRLQTIVFRKTLANTLKQARQLVTHGHIAIEGRRIRYPSYIVPTDLENNISYYKELAIKKIEPKESE
jgi:small subunit ribosomal protein S4